MSWALQARVFGTSVLTPCMHCTAEPVMCAGGVGQRVLLASATITSLELP